MGMKLGDIGERALVRRLSGIFSKGSGIIEGAGEDDCAVIDIGENECLVITTDMLHSTTDFPQRMSAWQIGWMSAAVNLSDIAAKGARPLGIVMAMGMPPELEVGFVEEIAVGMETCARTYGTYILGGDTDSHSELTIVGTAFGLTRKDLLIRRSGAKPGDLVCVTGHLGSAGAALRALESGREAGRDVMRALFEPVPRITEGLALAGTRAVTSMMDISDGLAVSLYELSRAGGVGFRVHAANIPMLPEVACLDDALELATYTGGDFELLFTVRPDVLDDVRKACSFSVIGEVIGEGVLIEGDGRVETLPERGYEHLKTTTYPGA